MSAAQKLEMCELGNKLYKEYKWNHELLTNDNQVLWAHVGGLKVNIETRNEAWFFEEYLKFIGKQIEEAAAIEYEDFGEFIMESMNNNEATMV